MPDSNYLDQIAALIKQDPSITVRQIASELKFADSKSVYYWLEKSNVSGINEFKRLVLGHQSSGPSSLSLDIDGIPHYVLPLPLLDWNLQQKNPGKEWYYFHSHPQPRGLFAIHVGTNRYSPWFLQNDILIVSKSKSYPEGSWALFALQQETLIGKLINKQIVDPITLAPYGPGLSAVGLIVHQQRHFSS